MSPKPEYYMHRALALAAEAAAAGEVPVGAVVVDPEGRRILGEGQNACIRLCDPSAHAEVQALRAAGQALGNYRLNGCDLYVTLEPCTLCVGALINARIRRVYYAAKEPRSGALASVCNLAAQPWYFHRLQVEGGLLQKRAQDLLVAFFAQRRSNAKNQKAAPTRE